MAGIINVARDEIHKLEKILCKVDSFLESAPKGCLKWQNKNNRTYYYHQFKLEDNKWGREYVKKEEISLANQLAMKYYYIQTKLLIENQLKELKKFVENYPTKKLEEVYDSMCPERKILCTPIVQSVKLLLDYIQETIKKGIDEGINCSQSYIDKLNNISGKYR